MSGKSTMKNFKEMLGQAQRPERSVEICLRGDLVAEFEQVERELKALQRQVTDSLDGGGAGDLIERLEALRGEMKEHSYPFRFRALPRPEFRALVRAHGPRKDPETGEVMEADRYIGVNTETFFDELIRRGVVDPEMDDADWKLLLDEKITDKQFDELADAAWAVNRNDVDIPFSHVASLMKRATEIE